MFLKSLELHNVRSIRRMEMDFTNAGGEIRKWTVVLGENGTGKSTVLRSIALVLAGSEALLDLVGDPDSWIRRGAKQCEIKARLVTAEGEEREIGLKFSRGQTATHVLRSNEKSLRLLDRALEHSARNYFTLGYGVSRRLAVSGSRIAEPDTSSRSPRAGSVATLFAIDANLVPFETWAMDLHYRKGKQGLSAVKSALRDFLPGVTFKTIDRQKRQLIFATEDGPVPLGQLSDGYQNAIGWCGDMLFRITEVFDDYKKPLHTRGLLLIDEIGLHLHPAWQRNLRNYLNDALKNLQIVATTHSPFTAHQCGEGELFSIARSNRRQGPELRAFDGIPNRLLLHQLVMTPFFGVSTMNSRIMEEHREEYRCLKDKRRKTTRERKRLEQLGETLSDQPEYSAGLPFHGEVAAMRQKIRET